MKKILFCDDSVTFSAMMTNALRMGGFEVTPVIKGADAVVAAKAGGPFDLIILDMILPDGTGIDILKILKGDDATKAYPVVILTARENADEIQTVMSSGGMAHMVKYKTTPKSLLEQVRTWLK